MAWLEIENSSVPTGKNPRLEEAARHLRSVDAVLARLIDQHGPCTLVPASSYFLVLLEAVISQQLSTKAAKAIYGRLLKSTGKRRPRPSDILAMDDAELLGFGLSRPKAAYVKNVARAFHGKRLDPETLAGKGDEEISAVLTSIKGIGEWSAQMFLIFALNRLDVFPVGDLGLRNAIARKYRLRKPPVRARIERIGNRWKPYRTVGTWYLWESYDNG